MNKLLKLPVICLVAAILTITACGGGGSKGANKDGTPPPDAPEISGIITGTFTEGQTITITGESGAVIEYTIDGGDTWIEYTGPVPLTAEGSYTITVRQTVDGVVSANTVTYVVTIDNDADAAPEIEDIAPGSFNTNQTFELDEPVGEIYQYTTDGGITWIDYTGPVTLSENGTYTVSARTVDAGGNVISALATPYTVTIDKEKPSRPVINGVVSGTYSVNVTFTISGDQPTIQYSIDNGSTWINYTGEVTLTAEDTYEITARQISATGRQSDNCDVITVTVDYIPAPPVISGLGSSFYNTDVEFSVDADEDNVEYSIDGGTEGTWIAYTDTVTLTEEREYTVVARQTDATNNVSGLSTSYTFTIDKTPTTPVTGVSADASEGQVTLHWTEPLDSDYSKVRITYTPGSGGPIEVLKGTTAAEILPLENGTEYTFTIRAVDAAGNVSEEVTVTATPALTPPTVSFSNIRENGVINSGFIIGSATDNASVASVEVSIDGGAFTAATGTTSWRFQLPTGTDTWIDGSTHTVIVRAVDNLGTRSSEVTVHVKKGVNKDVNGDGYSDVVSSARAYSNYTGRLYIFHSAGIAGINVSSASLASSIITGEAQYTSFGDGITTGDFNGDGYADIAASATSYNSNTGRVYIFYSSGISGISITAAASASVIISGQATMNNFGSSLTSGDVNYDGFADLIVGAEMYSTQTGRLYIFHSSGTSGIGITAAASASTIITGEVTNSFFGNAIVADDFNYDGYTDIACSARAYDSNRGRLYLFYSTGSNGVTITSAASASLIIAGETTGTQFGLSLASGDVNGDGYNDLIAGAPSYSSATGRVYIFNSTGTGGITITNSALASTIITGQSNSFFGCTVSAGDLNGDGYADIIAGAYMYNTSNGRAYIFHSAGSDGIAITSADSASLTITGVNGAQFGNNCLAADINGDGYTDMVITEANYNSQTGRIYAFHSSGSGGITITVPGSASSIITGETISSFFGSRLAK